MRDEISIDSSLVSRRNGMMRMGTRDDRVNTEEKGQEGDSLRSPCVSHLSEYYRSRLRRVSQ